MGRYGMTAVDDRLSSMCIVLLMWDFCDVRLAMARLVVGIFTAQRSLSIASAKDMHRNSSRNAVNTLPHGSPKLQCSVHMAFSLT